MECKYLWCSQEKALTTGLDLHSVLSLGLEWKFMQKWLFLVFLHTFTRLFPNQAAWNDVYLVLMNVEVKISRQKIVTRTQLFIYLFIFLFGK